MKNLENYGVLEMNAKEITEIDGGVIDPVVGGILIAVVAGIIYDWEDFKKGFFSAFN